MPLKSAWSLGISLVVMGTAGLSAQDARPLPYTQPAFAPLFDSSNFELYPATELQLRSALMGLARLPEIDGLTRGKVMALAYSLFPDDKDVILMDFKLRFSGDSGNTATETREELRTRLMEASRSFGTKPGETTIDSERMAALRFSGDLSYLLLSSESRAAVDSAREERYEQLRREGKNITTTRVDWSKAFAGRIDDTSATPALVAKVSSTLQGFPKRQSLVKGLLVIQLEGSQFAGEASQMNATAVPHGNAGPSTVSLNQEVGSSMSGALDRVLILLTEKHGGLPPGHKIEISFEEHYSSKDGPSAAVACALLLDSLITGKELDPAFAVTGDLSSDGKVEPVGGIDGKIRGASHRGCTHVAIPHVNRSALSDLLITDGIGPLAKIQVFTLQTFEEAQALSSTQSARDAKIQESIETFASVQKVLAQPGGERLLNTPQVRERLGKVVALTPNHASARLLLLKATNQEPKALSIGGSLAAIDQAVVPLQQAMASQRLRQRAALETGQITDAAYNLKRIRAKLDQRTWGVVDSLSDFADLLRNFQNNPPGSADRHNAMVEQIEASAKRIGESYSRLSRDPKIKSELGG